MGYYGKRQLRGGWSRRRATPSKYAVLEKLFGNAITEIREAFERLGADALDELFSEYGEIYGEAAEKYARTAHLSWKSGETQISGQTMERLVELVPPYLSASKRFSILRTVLKHNKPFPKCQTIKINVKEPGAGFGELERALAAMSHNDVLVRLPKEVMLAASWLYDDDITSARAMLAEAERLENELIRSSAAREIELLRRTIASGQVKAASYKVDMPAGKLNVVAYSPSLCFVATVCFGASAPETELLRAWRDLYLIERAWGRRFIVWYYNNGEKFADIASRFPLLKKFAKVVIGTLAKVAARQLRRGEK